MKMLAGSDIEGLSLADVNAAIVMLETNLAAAPDAHHREAECTLELLRRRRAALLLKLAALNRKAFTPRKYSTWDGI